MAKHEGEGIKILSHILDSKVGFVLVQESKVQENPFKNVFLGEPLHI